MGVADKLVSEKNNLQIFFGAIAPVLFPWFSAQGVAYKWVSKIESRKSQKVGYKWGVACREGLLINGGL